MIAPFLCSLAGGCCLVLGISRVQAAPRLVRLVGIIALTSAAGVLVWNVLRAPAGGAPPRVALALTGGAAVAAAGVVLLSGVAVGHERLLAGVCVLGGLSGVAAACIWTLASRDEAGAERWPTALTVLTVIGQLCGAFVIGTVTVAWLLGHAYLTATRLTIAPLRRLSRLFMLAVGLRGAFLLLCVSLVYFGTWQGAGLSFARLAGWWLILALRIVVGLVAVGVFAYMVDDCVKLRSTQSATGILYFASVFVYIGELSSQHIAEQLGLPL